MVAMCTTGSTYIEDSYSHSIMLPFLAPQYIGLFSLFSFDFPLILNSWINSVS